MGRGHFQLDVVRTEWFLKRLDFDDQIIKKRLDLLLAFWAGNDFQRFHLFKTKFVNENFKMDLKFSENKSNFFSSNFLQISDKTWKDQIISSALKTSNGPFKWCNRRSTSSRSAIIITNDPLLRWRQSALDDERVSRSRALLFPKCFCFYRAARELKPESIVFYKKLVTFSFEHRDLNRHEVISPASRVRLNDGSNDESEEWAVFVLVPNGLQSSARIRRRMAGKW